MGSTHMHNINEPPSNILEKDEGMDEQYKSLMYSYDIVHVIIFNSNYDFICLL
jgi:hypothetical protein